MAQSPQRLVNLSGTPVLESAVGLTTNPGSEVTLLSVVLGADRKLLQANVSCTQDGIFRIKDDGITIGVARTHSGKADAVWYWNAYYQAVTGHTITLTFEAASYGTPVGIDTFLQSLE